MADGRSRPDTVFLTSATEGLTATDELLADRLRLAKKPLILAVNKVDNDATGSFRLRSFTGWESPKLC